LKLKLLFFARESNFRLYKQPATQYFVNFLKAPMNIAKLLMLTSVVLANGLPVLAADGHDIGTVKSATGAVEIQRGVERLKAQPGMAVKQSDVVSTGASSTVGMTLHDNTVLAAGANSSLQMDKFNFDPKTQKGELQATLKRGTMAGISGAIAKSSPDAVQFKTASMTLGVRGTDFIIEAPQE
jgi:FecR protein